MNNTRQDIIFKLNIYTDEKKAENIEKSLYNFSLQYCNSKNIEKCWTNRLFIHVYKQRTCWILHHLEKNMLFVQAINNKTINARNVGFLKESDINHLDNDEKLIETSEDVADGIFQCRKCGSKKTTYYSLQTRSADEPMTNFITCVDCGNRWKM
uniref:TFIIS-type domain-containing protein n=1 Tax=viral metagenome TaxID=1070528 RepID=A0A6C0F660_9ZZZZ|tara:strand:+ start:443 stop:904 length:462 start_codon:yes stop_codon:yes gene_type:complete